MTSAAVTVDESRRSVADRDADDKSFERRVSPTARYAVARGSFLVDDNVDAGR
jgi:hypothetical protein